MSSKEEYDVLRLIEHGQTCYISSECVAGKILAGWLKNQPGIAKGRLFSMIRDVAGQLGMIHKCRKKPYYQYVNPYSIVITEEGKLYFLDMEAGSNEKHLKFMQKRVVRECFLPAEEAYYQKGSTNLDIYGAGKTIQYILSVASPSPPLNRREERRFQRIISKCLKYQSKSAYRSAAEIRRSIPQYRKKTRHIRTNKKRAFMIGIAMLSLAAAWKMQDLVYPGKEKMAAAVPAAENSREFQRTEKSEKTKEENEVRDNSIKTGTISSEDCSSYMEMAMAYILDVEDYEKSLDYLEKIQDAYAPAEDLHEIVEVLLGRKKEPARLRMHLKNLEKAASGEDKERYYRCLIRGYSLLNTKQSAEAILRLGECCLNEPGIGSSEAGEVREYMASACEKAGEYERAARLCEELLEQMKDGEKREETYRKIIVLYESSGQSDKALETCVRGLGERKTSEELRITHIRLLCQDAAVGRDLCARTIQEYIGQMPEILEKEEFQKLQREYEIQVEGDNVWVGR